MRILHTGDWHAGRTLGRQSLDPGLEHFLAEMVSYVKSEQVDVVLVAGDLFEHARPPSSSQQMVYQTFLELHKLGVPSLVIAGNHDSHGHWSALRPLFELAGIYVVPRPVLDSTFSVSTRSGRLEVAALAWPTERWLAPLIGSDGDDESRRVTWAARVGLMTQALCKRLGQSGPRVFLSHLLVNGSRIACSQRALSISDAYAVPADVFPPDLNYVALGHVHQPQSLQAPGKAAYAGAPRPMDFGEAGHPRGFNRVEVGRGKHTEVEFVALEPKQPLTHLTCCVSRLAEVFDEHRSSPGLLKLTIEVDALETGLADRVRAALPQAVIVQVVQRGSAPAERVVTNLLDPLETFRTFYHSENTVELPPEVESAFLEILEEARCADSQA